MPLGVLVPFDPPSMKPNCELRTSSTGATQSLLMLNDPFVVEQVEALATRVMQQADASSQARFQLAWWLVFGRNPTSDETAAGVGFLDDEVAAIRTDESDNSKTDGPDHEREALAHLCHALVSSNGFLYID